MASAVSNPDFTQGISWVVQLLSTLNLLELMDSLFTLFPPIPTLVLFNLFLNFLLLFPVNPSVNSQSYAPLRTRFGHTLVTVHLFVSLLANIVGVTIPFVIVHAWLCIPPDARTPWETTVVVALCVVMGILAADMLGDWGAYASEWLEVRQVLCPGGLGKLPRYARFVSWFRDLKHGPVNRGNWGSDQGPVELGLRVASEKDDQCAMEMGLYVLKQDLDASTLQHPCT